MTTPTRAATAELARPANVVVDDFGKPGDAEIFAALNLEWLHEFFYVEEEDKRLLTNPFANIILKGGHIFCARRGSRVLGVCGLIKLDGEAYEIGKMAVDKAFRGQGIARLLMEAAIDRATRLGAQKILICTSSKLENAIRIYRGFGFIDSDDPRHHRYDRSDVYLEKELR